MTNIIYKYQNWSNEYNRKSFINRELFFSGPNLFNDPFDSKLYIIPNKVIRTDQEIMEDLERKGESYLVSDDTIRSEREKWEIDEHASEGYDDDSPVFSRNLTEEATKNDGILCLSEVKDNILMWSHYANSHKGYCIGFDEDKLFLFLKDYFKSRGGEENFWYRRISYVEDIPQLNMDEIVATDGKINEDKLGEFLHELVNTKSSSWAYEKEKRFSALNYSNQVVKVPPDIYKEIIFGCKMDDSDKKAIEILCKTLYPKIEIYQAEVSVKKINLEIKLYSPSSPHK